MGIIQKRGKSMVKKRTTGYLLQDAGLVLLLLCIGGAAIAVGSVEEAMKNEFVIMLMGTFFAILLAGFKLTGISVVAGAFEILLYTAYKNRKSDV